MFICNFFFAENMNFSIEPFATDSQLNDIEEIRRLYDLFDVSFINYLLFLIY